MKAGMTTRFTIGALVLVGLVWLAGCGGSDTGGVDTRANLYATSAVTNFSGPDGDDTDARQDARALMVNRTFDLTPSGFVLQSATASTAAGGNVNFGSGTGTVNLTGDSGLLVLGIAPADPSYSNVDLSGTFSAAAAQSAIDNAGNTFTVNWEMSYTHGAISYEIHFESTLTGADFRQI